MIKYLGSKRVLVPVLGQIATDVGARTALDLFTGTTRVAQEFKRRGLHVTAVDTARYAHTLAECYVASDPGALDPDELDAAVCELNALPGRRGYFTEVFCERSRYLQPHNGQRVDAIRDAIEERYAGSPLRPVLLTSLLEAADRVDSTTGLQMAYLKQWSARSFKDLQLRVPELIPGVGRALCADATETAGSTETLDAVDLAYLDPPYNQHRYFTNYHVWETLVRWDAPEHYGIACKRADAREPHTHSAFNLRRQMPAALAAVIARTRARVVVVSYNDESWVDEKQITGWLRESGHESVRLLAFDSRRYVGARIGIYNPAGERVGKVGRLRNVEYLFLAGPRSVVEAVEVPAA